MDHKEHEQLTHGQKVILTKNTTKNFNQQLQQSSSHNTDNHQQKCTLTVDTDPSPAVHLDHVTFSYDHCEKSKKPPILNDVNLTVPKSIIYSLLGSSGCGKTTLLRCIIGRLSPQHGTVHVFGKEPNSQGSQIPGPGVGYMPQELALISQFTIHETLVYYGTLYQMSAASLSHRIPFLMKLLDLHGFDDKFVDNLSGGQRRRVSLAIALIANPPLLILDEPTVGVDPLLRETIWKYLMTIAAEGLTVIITTHYIEEARNTNVVAFMRHGRLLAEDNPQKLMRQFMAPTLERVFLLMAQNDSDQNDSEDEEILHDKRLGSIIRHPQLGFMTLDNGQRPSTSSDAEMSNSRDLQWPEVMIPLTKIITDEIIDNNDKHDDSGNMSEVTDNNPISGDNNNKDNDESLAKVPPQSSASIVFVHNPIIKASSSSRPKPLKIRIKESSIRIGALCRKNRIRLLRRPPELIINVIMPALQVALFCLCIGRDPKDVRVAVNNQEVEPYLSSWFLESMDTDIIKLEYYNSPSLAIDSVRDGNTWGAMIFNANYSDALQKMYLEFEHLDKVTYEESTIRIYLDASNALYSNTVRKQIYNAVQRFGERAADAINEDLTRFKLPIKFEEPIYGTENTDMVAFMGPGLIVLMCFFGTTAVTSIAFLSERREGSLERTLVAGVTSAEFIAAQMLIVIILLTFQIIITGIMSFWLFAIPQHGSYFWAISLMFLQGICGMSYGLMISAICTQEINAILFGFGSMLPATNITGMFWPVGTMPPFLRYVSYLMPHTFAMEAFRNIVIRGFGPSRPMVMMGFLVTGAWISVFLLVAILVFKNNK